MEPAKEEQIRDRLWAALWTLEYKAAYAHESARFMVQRWMIADMTSRLLTALFASTSAISGWALWSNEKGKVIWLCLSGLTAVVAISDGVLSSKEKVKRYSELSGSFLRLSETLKGLLSDMRIEVDFDVDSMRKRHEELRARYAETLEGFPVDLFFTKKNQKALQDYLNEKQEYATGTHPGSTSEAAAAAAAAA